MSHDNDAFFEAQLRSLKDGGLFRDLDASGFHSDRDEGCLSGLNFSSNDYLGLSRDARLRRAAARTAEEYGTGSTASRLLAGNYPLIEELETALATLVGTEASLVFGSGFLTNLGVLTALGSDSEFFSDELNHASIIDGIRLSRAHCVKYRHKDLDHLETLLSECTGRGRKVIVSESLFSMDGDLAPLRGLADLALRHEALLIIDEAHAVGVMGQGGGICRDLGVTPDIVAGTLSKALGGYGGFAACSLTARLFLINKARSFIYSTGLPPSSAASAREAVSVITGDPGIGDRLLRKASGFRDMLVAGGFDLPPFESHILQIPIGSNERALSFAGLVREQGLFIRAIRPPTVPAGTSRVRLSMTLAMPDAALERAANIMAGAGRKVGLIA